MMLDRTILLVEYNPDDAGRKPQLPRAILLDLKLPKRGGLEVLQRIRVEPATELLPW